MRLPFLAACLCAAACGGGPGEGFASSMAPQITSVSGSAASSTSPASTSNEPGSSTSGASSTSGDSSTSGPSSTSAGATTETIYDLGAGSDVGPLQPPGCKDKI
ncbi:MAG TPA: hypothetical protein VGB85_17880, partial [Nannocystis sp.]